MMELAFPEVVLFLFDLVVSFFFCLFVYIRDHGNCSLSSGISTAAE